MSRSVTLKGSVLVLDGTELGVGDKAPNACLRSDLVSDFELDSLHGNIRVFSVVPSLDTTVCAVQTRRFNTEVDSLSGAKVVTISCDLPVAMSRFCGAEGIDPDRMLTLSDHKYLAFGKAYGTLLPDLRILCRAVFVVDCDGIVQWAEYVPELSEHPDYDGIVKCLACLDCPR